MVSRLDRLFILLDTGSNESIRLAAAKQLGEVQRVQPNDLNYLLRRIKEYSSKLVWETRVAAGHATSCVLEQVETWPPTIEHPDSEDDKIKSRQQIAEQLIEKHVKPEQILEQFDLDKIMSLCPMLLSIDATEPDDQELVTPSSSRGTTSKNRTSRKDTKSSSLKKNDKEQLMRQRKLINKELGISDSLNLGVKSTDIVTNDDLQLYDSANKTTKSAMSQQDARAILKESISNYDNLIKILGEANCISAHKAPTSDSAHEKDTICADPNVWPLQDITRQYVDDLFNPAWEIRHGAAIALREIARLQGKSVGKRSDLGCSSNQALNQLWLADMALRAICVLALDKFGDFLFDQVVAPVRENAAQLLGCCVSIMSEPSAHMTMRILLKMFDNPRWEVRHGGIIGLKYSLNVVNDSFSKRLLQECFDPIFNLLGDSVDDVSAEAAAALVPVKDLMIETIPEKAPKLIKFLWEHLADLDELTTSTSNIVLLLASLITSSSTELNPSELIKSIPRLWPLLGHSSTAVRVSVLKALKTLIKTQNSTCLSWMPDQLITIALRLLYQRSILENMDEVRPFIEEVWLLLLKVNDDPIKAPVERLNLLRSTSQYLNYWLCLIMQPLNAPIDRGSPLWLNIRPDGSFSDQKPDGEVHIGSITFSAETLNQQKLQVTKCRFLGTRLVGALYARLVFDRNESQHASETLKYLSDMFAHYIQTKSANTRIYSGWALESWANNQTQLWLHDLTQLKSFLPNNLTNQLDIAIQETTLCYDELAANFTRLQQETREFVATLKDTDINLNISKANDKKAIYNLNEIQTLCEINLETELVRVSSKRAQNSNKSDSAHNVSESKVYAILTGKKNNLIKSSRTTNQAQKTLSTSVLSSIACAKISWQLIPDKLNLVTDPLIDSIVTEEESSLQDKSIKYLITLFDILCRDFNQYSNLIESILERLIDVLDVKNVSSLNSEGESLGIAAKVTGTEAYRIILLDNLQRKAESRAVMRRQSSVASNAPSMKRSLSLSSSHELDTDTTTAEEQIRLAKQREISFRGASLALSSLAKHFNENLPAKLPMFWSCMTLDIKSQLDLHAKNASDIEFNFENENKLIKSLLLLEIAGENVDSKLHGDLLDLFQRLVGLLVYPKSIIRHRVSQCLGVVSKIMFEQTIEVIKKNILPMLDQDDNILARCGSIEAIASIIEHLQLDIVPRIDMFIVHVLRRMSDQNDQVRLMATHCFGKLLSLMPLKLDSNTKDGNTKEYSAHPEMKKNGDSDCVRSEEQKFIEQLLNPRKLDNFVIPFKTNAQPRSYQQEGLNWLYFLNRFNLHGILCDEMGLGKTFMTICMVASDHYSIEQNQDVNQGSCRKRCPPSLIVCPSTLTEHWLYEIVKFVPAHTRPIINSAVYTGSATDRTLLRNKILDSIIKTSESTSDEVECGRINLVISSYDIVRNDIDFFKEVHWNYCVLDEGHIIKNVKTKLSKAVRLLSAKHRVILSGTPIQNNVTELWSLFDFLMPGFLGSERQFNNRYAKPILQSREPKCSPRDLEAGALAMESLHRQVLPFTLRRLKKDVLDDLPPKIIQDYYCELSSLQHKLYEDFTRSKLCKDVTKKSLDNLLDNDNDDNVSAMDVKANSKSHVFQALQYLKNVCNHPKLVLTPKHSQYAAIKKSLDAEKSCLDDIVHSSKLKALKQLLIDCGIGGANSSTLLDEQNPSQQQQSLPLESVVNQHRALVFCQVRSMVNIIENDLLMKHFPGITYLKLDGSVPPNQRQSIVSRFNDDPSIDILLLTTQIGGLGLNLTGADTVIFVEHDWNPTKDLQAMDRAHRIGQKRVVNVYRLITKATLEEKIMGLQKFKTMVSNTVINQDNTSLGTMNVDQIFDLFDDNSLADSRGISIPTNSGQCHANEGGRPKKSNIADLLPELWDQQQYETEYDLSNFVSSLKN